MIKAYINTVRKDANSHLTHIGSQPSLTRFIAILRFQNTNLGSSDISGPTIFTATAIVKKLKRAPQIIDTMTYLEILSGSNILSREYREIAFR